MHRLLDGKRVGSIRVPGLTYFLAADPSTGTIFGNTRTDRRAIAHFSWSLEAGILAGGTVTAEGVTKQHRAQPLAVVPPAPGKRVSHLVVGVVDEPTLFVLALPCLTLVHTHLMEGVRIATLAADPWGEALAVSNLTTSAIHILAWPLPGMPALT